MSIFSDFRSASRGNAAPVTTALIVVMVAMFVLIWMRVVPLSLVSSLIFTADAGIRRPWTLLTYPFLPTGLGTNGAIGVFFICLWLWGIGGSVERDLGPVKYLAVWLVFSALCALGVFIGAKILNIPGAMSGGWVPVSAVTIIWGTRNPTATILLMFVIPITGKWLAWLSAALVIFATVPELAPFAAAPLFLAYLFAANKIPFAPYTAGPPGFQAAAKKHERYGKVYYEEVRRREKERQDRERLRKLFEGSLEDDDKGK